MSPAEKRLGGAGHMVAQTWTVGRSPPQGPARSRSPPQGPAWTRSPPQGPAWTRSPPQGPSWSRSPPQGPAWSRCPALLLVLVALISALQHPVQGSLTVQPDAGTIDESWPPEELSSSAASEILGLYIQEEIENNTMFYNTTPTSNIVNDTSPTSSIQNNVSVQFEEPGPSESPMLFSFQPTDPGLNNTSILPLSTIHPSYNPFSTGDNTASSLPSPPSSFPSSFLSSSSPYQSSSSVTDVYYKSSTSPYFDKVTEEEVLTQETSTNVLDFSSNAASPSVYTTSSWEATRNGTTDLVKDYQSLEATQALTSLDPALYATEADSLGQTSNKTESLSIDDTTLTLKTSSMAPIYTLPYESVVTSRSTESEVDSFSLSDKPSTPLHTNFTTPLNTLDSSSSEPDQVGTYTTLESGRITNTSTYVPMTQEESVSFSPVSTEQPSTRAIEFNSIYFTDSTTIQSSEETSLKTTISSFDLSTSPSAIMSSMAVTTLTPLNSSMAFISVQSSKNTEAEHILGSSLSNEYSANIDTSTNVKISSMTDLLTSTLHSQSVMEIKTSLIPTQFTSFSEDMASQITFTVVPSTNRSSLTSISPSETPPEETSSVKTLTVTYSTNTMTEIPETGPTVDTNPIFTDSPYEKTTVISSTSTTLSTSEESTSVNIELSPIAVTEVASSLKATTLPLSLDTNSDNIANVTSSLKTNTATMFHTHSGATLEPKTAPEMSTLTIINDTSTNTEIQQTPVKPTALPISLERTSDIALGTNDIANVTSPMEINTSTKLHLQSGATLASETPTEISMLTVINDTSTNTEVQQTSATTTTLPISLDTTSAMTMETTNEFANITSPLETNTSAVLYPHSDATLVSETPPESSTFTGRNYTSTNTDIQQTSAKTTTLPMSIDTTSEEELWTSNEFGNVTFPSETNTTTSGTTLTSDTPLEISTFTMRNYTSANTEIQQTSAKTTTLPVSLDTTSDMELWTSNEFGNVTFPLETNTTSGTTLTSDTPLEISTFTMRNDSSTNTEMQQTFSTGETTHITTSSKEESSLSSTVQEPITLNTLETIVKSTSNLDVSEMTSQTVTDNSSAMSISTSAPELDISTVTGSSPSTRSEPLTLSSVSFAIQETSTNANSMEGNSTSYSTPYSSHTTTSSEEESTPTILESITSNLTTLEATLKLTSNLHVSKITTQSLTDNSSPISDIISTPEGNTSAVVVSSQSTGTEMLTFSWVSSAIQETSTSANNMEGNSTTYSGYTATSVLNDTMSVRTTTSTTYQSSSFPTSNFNELSTDIRTSSEQSTSPIEGVSVVTSPVESTVGSIEVSSSNTGTPGTITDNVIETATGTLPVTSKISTMLSSQATNTNANTKRLPESTESTTWDISSPLPLTSDVATTFFSTSIQPSVSATSYMSSTAQITTALDNTGSQGSVMLSSSQSTDSMTISTSQASSRNSEYLTSSYGPQRTTTNSPSSVTSLPSQPATQTELAAATTLDMVNSTKSTTHTGDTIVSTLHTTYHLSSTTIKSNHSSSFSPLTTTNLPTNISDSFSTVSSVLPSAGVSTVSTTGNATQNFTSTEKPPPFSSVTLTTPTTHESPSIIYTLLSTQFTKTDQTSTLGVITTRSTPTNHTMHTPITALLPTTSQTTTITSPSLTTTHTPSTDTVTTVPDTTKVSTVLIHTVPSSTKPSTETSLRTSVASVTTATNATIVNITTLTTMLSPSTTPSSFKCKPSYDNMVKTVLILMYQPTKEDKEAIMQTFQVFLNHTLYQALNQSIQVFMNSTTLNESSQPRNMTLGYSVSVNNSLYIPSAIVDVLTGSNVFDVAKLKLNISGLQSVPIIAEPWEPEPDISFRVKTILKLMGTGANIHTCVYVRNMEQKLQTAFETAEFTSTGMSSNLSVQILNTSIESQILTLIYVVKNNSRALNGTTTSSLLNVLSGEVVGYYLGDPPSIIAEPLYYPNIDISDSTMSYWVNTVIQGVDSQLLGANNQSFARQMEERLATLFQISSQQSRRFRRATNVGSYTVQMVKMQRLVGANNLAELTYYALKDGQPIQGTSAAKLLSTIDPQTMALTLGYIVRVQASSVVQVPPNNLWIIAAVLAPIAVVTVIIIIITAVLCRKNKSDFKSENISNLPPRTKPVQGFDYAKQHLGQQGGDEDALPATQETVVPSLNLSQERDSTKDGSTEKMLKSSDNRKSRSPCENGSVISNESEEASSDGSTPQKVMAQHRVTKDEACKRNVPISDEEEGNIHYDKNKMISDPFDSSSGSVQLIAIKPVSIPPALTISERNQEMSIINGEVNKALKQKSDIEHYRNKLRLKAKRKGYYDFPPIETKSLNDRKRKAYENTQMEIDNVLDAGTDTSSPFAEPKNRQTSMKNHPYRSRQSLNSPSPGETEMDLLVTRERPRRGIRNSGYDTEPEIIEETNIDRVKQARTYIKSRQAKGHSETSTLSSQPSIDEVRQQMHMLLEEAFSLASAGHGGPKRQTDPYASAQHIPYSDVVTSAPGTMSRPRVQWVPTYGPEMYQYSLPRPNYRFSQLPEMVVGSPPPPVPPRTGPVAVPSLRRSTSDMAKKSRMPEPGGNDQGPGEHVGFPAVSRGPVPVAQTDQSVSNYSGNSMPAVFAIPGNRAAYSGYYIPQPPASYRNQAWMSYSGENDLPGQWADSVPLPGYIEAYPRSRYPQNSPSRLPRQFGQPVNLHPSLDHATGPSIGASQQSLADTDTPDASITNLSTAALVKAIREEVAKLAKKQTDMFEFQV